MVRVQFNANDSTVSASKIVAHNDLRRPLLLNLGIALRSARLGFWVTPPMFHARWPTLPENPASLAAKLARA
jgi:hypothetical protein